MNLANRVQNRFKSTKKRRSADKASHRRRVLFEQLEDRRLLALTTVADFGAEGEGDTHGGSGLVYSAPRHYEGIRGGYLTNPRSGDSLTIALNYLRQNASRLGLASGDLDDAIVKTQYFSESTGVTHIALRQTHNDLEVKAADILVNVMSDGRILDVFSSFVPNIGSTGATTQTTVGAAAAFSQFAQEFKFDLVSEPLVLNFEGGSASKTVLSRGGLADRSVVAELVYVPVDNGGQPGIELAWNLNVQMLGQGHWYSASMSAEGGGNLYFEDWVANASYNAVALPNESPIDGTGREIIVDPADPAFSPFGWHDANGLAGPEFFDTRGNNVDSREDRDNTGIAGNPAPTLRPNGGANLTFNSPLNLTQDPLAYTDASVTNLFVWNNFAHDIFARAGFTEEAGNFQSKNYSSRGLGGDPVLAMAQVGDNAAMALNNAFFATPADGTQPLMIMGTQDIDFSDTILNTTGIGNPSPTFAPRRDIGLDTQTIIHEYGHGVTNRLTGGGANVGALNALQSQGMGEGWGDYFALHFMQNSADQRDDGYPIFGYSDGPNPLTPEAGERRFAYSFDMSINPLTYVDFNGGGIMGFPNDEVHNSGEIWAQTLWDMHWLLIEKYGYDPDLYEGTGGNNLAFQLVMDGLTLQPVLPTFLDARDAILRADFIRNQGVNHKEIWEAFARRGMGFSANHDIDNGMIPANSNRVRAAFDLPPNPVFIRGSVWSDINGNGIRDGEPGIANWEVYIDLNGNGTRGPLEPAMTTDANGDYSFQLYLPATLRIAETLQVGRSQTFPLANQDQTVSITFGTIVNDVDFGIRDSSVVSNGVKFNDLDGDGSRDDNEPGIPGFWIYIDYDDDGRLDLGEPTSITKEDGSYNLTIDRNGTFKVREINMPGWVQTFPGGVDQAHVVTVTNGSLNLNLNFGNIAAVDFGDAPDSYGTTIDANGASHGILANLLLGGTVDTEANGVPSANADGDDTNGSPDDEDGVRFNNIFFPGSSSEIEVTVFTGTNSPARLNAWFDFNRNGVFTDPGEQVIVADRKGTGTHTYTIQVPADAAPGLTYARFRYGYEGNIGPTGPTGSGEVEDYVVRILNDTPEAIDDQFTVDQDSSANQFLVLANDISSLNDPITVTNTTLPNSGGRVLVSAGGTFVSYTPAAGFSGVEMFNYTITDGAGIMSDPATVTVTVRPARIDPFAVDDSYDVQTSSSNIALPVLINDLAGQNGGIELVDVSAASLGFVMIDRNGTNNNALDDVIRYTPNPGVSGTDQFTYTIQDARPISQGGPVQSTATVTVHIQPGDMDDDLMQYRIQTVDSNGTPMNTILVGEQFGIQVWVSDLRTSGVENDLFGVAAGYLDVLYDSTAISVAGDIVYGPNYQNVRSGNVTIPGVIDEVGAFQTSTNDPVGQGEFLLFEIPMNANVRGETAIIGDPADIVPFHDTLFFQPPQPIDVRSQRFINTSSDGSAPMLNHILTIDDPGGLPKAVDNIFHVDFNSSNIVLDVLANDVEPDGQALTISAVGARSDGGTALITSNATRLTYTPRAGFSGAEQFTYTARNTDGDLAVATVTVQVGASAKDINIRLEATDENGMVITEIAQGLTFDLRAYVQDLRSNDGDGDSNDERGVFAAYFDLLFDTNIVSTIVTADPLGFDIEFGDNYLNGSSGVPQENVLNEFGAFQTNQNPLGPTEQLVATIKLRANAAGTTSILADPADVSPLHDTLLFEPTEPVNIDRINHGFTSITVTTGSSGEGEHFRQNPHNRRDVNGDGSVSPSDVLAGINKLNSLASQGIAEGEEHELKLYDVDGNRQMYYDTNGDGHHSPADILSVVNYLNDRINQGIAEGEGGLPVWIAAAPQFGHPDDALLTRNAVPSGNALLAATDQPQRPAAEDEVFQMIGERDHESDSHAEWLDLDDDTGFMTDW